MQKGNPIGQVKVDTMVMDFDPSIDLYALVPE